MPNAAIKLIEKFRSNAPKKTKNSPIKLVVPGKAIFAMLKNKNIIEKIGILITRPP